MIPVNVVLSFLSILLFATSAVEASLSDLENIKPSRPINPETESPTQDEAEAESPTQDEAESGVANTRTYPTEEEYCKVNILNEDPKTREDYILKFGTNDADKIYGTPDKDLILGLDGTDLIFGMGNDDIICGGKGDDYIRGESESEPGNKVIIQEPGNDLIFGQDGKDGLYGGPGNDFLQGSIGNDHLVGDDGGDLNYENDGNDLMDGGADSDGCEDQQGKTFLNCELEWDGIIK